MEFPVKRTRTIATLTAALTLSMVVAPYVVRADEAPRHCQRTTTARMPAAHPCHESEAPTASLSCCCARDDSVPASSMPGQQETARPAAAATALGTVVDVVPRPAIVGAGVSTPPTRGRPLFTLFSTLLI